MATLNRAIHAHRASRADPHARDVSAEAALVVRIGYGPGDAVADGHFEQAWELPRERRRTRRSMEGPEERFAALLGGREQVLACEELVLRARADLDAGRVREAALQARVALESLLAEMPEIPGDRRPALEADRELVGRAANAALTGELTDDLARLFARQLCAWSPRSVPAASAAPEVTRSSPRGLRAPSLRLDTRSSRRPASLANWR